MPRGDNPKHHSKNTRKSGKPPLQKHILPQNKGGQAVKFDDQFCQLAYNYALLGATNDQLDELLDVPKGTCEKSLRSPFDKTGALRPRWRKSTVELGRAIKLGKAQADAEVAYALYRRATGYSHPDVHVAAYKGFVTVTPIVKHYPPDPVSMIFWLKNRARDRWNDRVTKEEQQDTLPGRVEIVIRDARDGALVPEVRSGGANMIIEAPRDCLDQQDEHDEDDAVVTTGNVIPLPRRVVGR